MKACEHCRNPLQRKTAEEDRHFNRRRFCGSECANASRRFDPPTRVCMTCGCDIPRVIAGRRIRPNDYARRRFCSNTCKTGTPAFDLPPVQLVRQEWNHLSEYSSSFTPEQLAARMNVPAWYVEQAVAS